MSNNNITLFLLQPALNTSTLSCDVQPHSYDFYKVILPVLVAIAILSPMAVVGNGLVLVAIWRNPSLRTPSYILLAGLAFTDFCTGIISEPFLVAKELLNLLIKLPDRNTWPFAYSIVRSISYCCFEYFFNFTLLIVTFMSIERWLHMSRRSLLTVRRVCQIIAVLLFIPILFVVYLFYLLQGTYKFTYLFANISFVLLCLFVTSVAYFNVFRIIRRHQQQIQANESSPSFAQPAINFEKYKKSVISILYILIIFYTGYFPMAITLGLLLVFPENCSITVLSFYVSTVLLFLSSTLNPLLYLWRIKDIRVEVRKLVKRIFCKDN